MSSRSRKTGKSGPNQTLLIGDDLLIEILSRISTPVVAIRCKLVCKSWCSLISSRYFISRFKQQHIEHESRYPKPLSGRLANTVRRLDIAEDSEFNFRGFNLDYLPVEYENIKVVASCNDLIICGDRRNDPSDGNYYLCNPFTTQWAALPPQPPPSPRWRCYRTGLVCKPGNHGDRFQYRIVHFYMELDISRHEILYHLVINCWETSEWTPYVDRGKEYSFGSKIAAFNGKLHWVSRAGYLVTLDPFNMRQTSLELINGAYKDGNLWCWEQCHVEECQGVLRVMRIDCRIEQGFITFKGINVWELQEDEHDLDATRLIFKDLIVLSDLTQVIDIVGFHPRNQDVLFLGNQGLLSSFNTKTRELKAETRFDVRYGYQYLFTLQLPWWPTPIPSESFSHINDIQLEGSEPS